MRKLKKSAALIFMLFIFVFGGYSVSAAEESHIYDFDNSLSDEEEKILASEINSAEDKYGLNIAIVITSDLNGKSSQSYADDFYDDKFGINTNGILFLMDNYSQWDHISTSGSAVSMYSEKYIDKMFSAVTPDIKRGDYLGASEKFLDMLDKKNAAINGFFRMLPFGAAAGCLISLVACLIIAHGYKHRNKISPRNYVSENETHFTVKQDRYVRQYTTKVKIESDSSSSGSGGSTHTSSSGGTHGGHSHHR